MTKYIGEIERVLQNHYLTILDHLHFNSVVYRQMYWRAWEKSLIGKYFKPVYIEAETTDQYDQRGFSKMAVSYEYGTPAIEVCSFYFFFILLSSFLHYISVGAKYRQIIWQFACLYAMRIELICMTRGSLRGIRIHTSD
jgi:hypothetical protein